LIQGQVHVLGSRRLQTDGEDFYIAPGVQVIGAVRLGAGASLWFNAVLRADEELIDIGAGSNIQDGSIIHCDHGSPARVGRDVTVGHRALLHGCTIEDETLIGNGAMVLDGARIGRHCVIAAGTLIPPRLQIPDRSVVMGAPGKVVRVATDKDLAMIAASAAHYRARVALYRELLRPMD